MQKCFLLVLGFLLATFCSSAQAADIYVSPNGSDDNNGSAETPVASLAAAQQKARAVAGKETVTVHVADGVYYLPEKLVFTPADSGTESSPVSYVAANEGGAILSGGSELALSWQPYKDGIFQAQTPEGLVIDQVFVDGTNQRMARYPNYDREKKAQPYQGYSADAFSKERAAGWKDPTGGFIHALHRSRWGGYHYLITGKDAKGKVTYEGGWQNNRQMGMHKDFRMVENIFEELDAEGEWYHNAKTNALYYKPAGDLNLNEAKVEVVRLRHLVEFQGTLTEPVKHVTLKGFVLRHTARTFMDCKEQLLRTDWAIYRGGAVVLKGTEDVKILDCEFDQVGGNGVFVNHYNRRTQVKGCHIHDCGASGVCLIGDPDAVRNPLFEYREKNDLEKIDRTPGPKTQNFPSLCTVEDCLIHGIGRVERQPAGVVIDMASEITIRDCSVYDCARSGLNIGDGAWGGHLIERCDVFDTVMETHDHGSFNSWGRDRFWRSDLKVSQAAVDADPNLPFLDAMKTTVIRNSRWRCDHGWDIDLDDGSSNYDIYNNLMLNSGLKLREGFRRHVWNNVAPKGGLHPHVWFQRSKDEVGSNIFKRPHQYARMKGLYNDGGTTVDKNLFTSTDNSILQRARQRGWDYHSELGDPMYVDAANGDFRVKEGSPALKLGFKNFPMDQFGVKKASLKAIAETPKIPSLKDDGKFRDRDEKSKVAVVAAEKVWLGAKLNDLVGEAFSAFGVSKEEGGVALASVPKGTDLKTGDLIQAVNGDVVKNSGQFFKSLAKTGSAPLKLKVVRNQQVIQVTVEPVSYAQFETADSAEGFKELPVPGSKDWKIAANPKTNNDPLKTLTDGKLDQSYGPIFGNGVNGKYKIDLGQAQRVSAVTSWSHRQGGKRGAQMLTVYGSNSATDPGWKLSKFTPLGTLEIGKTESKFTAASLRAAEGKSLGKYRWIVWAVQPISSVGGGENTSFQELSVEVAGQDPAAKDVGAKDVGATAPSKFPGEKTDFHGYDCYQFKIADNRADVKVICPKQSAPGKPWLWRSLFWERLDLIRNADLKLVDQGYHIVLVHGDVAGHPSGNANIDAAYERLTNEHGFAKQCSMASMSRGTLSLFRWAAANPEKVNSIYVDNGVCNIKSWPAGKLVEGSGSIASGAPKPWAYFKEKFGYSTDEEALNSKQSPIDQLEPLARADVPILMVCGNKDPAVPYEENDALLEQRYKALGGDIKVIVEEKGHTHGMEDPTPVIEFIKQNTQPSAESDLSKPDSRPNIVFVMTDDQRWDGLGCYGRTDVKTPNIDQLASQGVTFDSAYYAVAICMPSRATMFTGRHFSDHRVGFVYPYNRTLPKEEFADSYPAQLKKAGYRTGFVGKFGIRLEDTQTTAAKHFDFFAVGGMIWPKEDADLKNIFRKERPKTERTLKKGDAMIRFLETQPKGQPFCFSISFDAVKNDKDRDMHTPHVELFKDQQMWVPENWVEGKNPELPKVLDYCRGTRLHVARTSTPEKYQRLARRFAVQGYTVDQQVGRLVAKLKEMDVLDNTVIIYTSDNGRFHGSHGIYDKCILYKEAVKAPFIVFDGRAGKNHRGRREDAIISSVDVAPTIVSLAGLDIPEIMQGSDLTDVLSGTQDMSSWRDAVLMENLFIQSLHSARNKKPEEISQINEQTIAQNQSYRSRGVRTKRYKYFKYFEHDPVIEELYDLESDPDEQDNLIANPEYAEVLSKMRNRTEELYKEATQ